jgi:hypothetical protein
MRRLYPIYFALLFVLAAPSAHATTVLRVSLEKMATTSDLIVHGVVTTSQSVAVNGNPRHLRTRVVVQIRTLLKGTQRGTLELDLPGGALGDYTLRIPGMPTFAPGQEVVLFLEKTSRSWALTGLSQGKYAVFLAPNGRKMVRRQLNGVHFVGFDAKGRTTPVPVPADKPQQTLSGLMAEVRFYLQKQVAP